MNIFEKPSKHGSWVRCVFSDEISNNYISNFFDENEAMVSHVLPGSASRAISCRKCIRICIAIIAFLMIFNAEKIDPGINLKPVYERAKKIGQGQENESQWHSSQPEKIVPIFNRKNDDDIRYAAFGTGNTWGETLDVREQSAYVKKLSPKKGINFGMKGGSTNYAAACTKSIIGNQQFDVIILEYFTTADQGMMTLAKRLRDHFPDAVIVIARFWDPSMLENARGMSLKTWAHDKGFGDGFIHDEDFKEEFLGTSSWNRWQWIFRTKLRDKIDLHETIARETGSYIIQMAWDRHAAGNKGYLETGDKMFGPDSFHLSKAGHEDFANRVKALVDRVGVPINPSATMGQWDSLDFCLNWYQTGIVGNGLKHSDNGIVGKIPNTEKYALTFEGVDKQGWIEMTNPSNSIMHIFVAYMTTGPFRDKYPKTLATREDENPTQKILNPVTSWNIQKMQVYLGQVSPGKVARISFKPLEESTLPFRIVQAVLTEIPGFGTAGTR